MAAIEWVSAPFRIELNHGLLSLYFTRGTAFCARRESPGIGEVDDSDRGPRQRDSERASRGTVEYVDEQHLESFHSSSALV